MKRLFIIIICICTLIASTSLTAYANDDGKIDLYEVFSNKNDQAKTDVGSRIYKFSMHLPDDAVIYKSERANFFDMSTNSYQASIALEVNRNKDELTLEEMLYKIQNNSRRENYWIWGDKEFVVDIAQDAYGQKYIRMIKANKNYDYFMVDEAAEEFADYIENRIYIANNYIYNLNVSMVGEFYRQHPEMFDKLVSSFKLYFDENNQYIKELSDSVSATREYKNTSYGWRIVMSPYWKLEGTPNSRHQDFRQVYSDEELNQGNNKETENEFKVSEGITVSLVSSAQAGETASKWAGEEIDLLKNNYHRDVYEILKNEAKAQNGLDCHQVVIRYKTVTKKPYIVSSLYVIGNGYKYLVSAKVTEEKYQDSSKRASFDSMLNSFSLSREYISKYLGKIIAAESLLNFSNLKDLYIKKYDYATKVARSWDISKYNGGYNDGYYYDDYYNKYNMQGNNGGPVNNESVSAYEPASNIYLNMSVGLDASEIDETISNRVQKYTTDNEVLMNLAKVNIQSTQHDGALLYRIEKEYDMEAIKSFVEKDATKTYNLEALNNEYEYIIKIGKDIYIQSMTLPVANATDKNKQKISDIWQNTSIKKVNYSKLGLSWKQRSLDEFNKQKEN